MDARLTPFNGRVAHVSLRGRVEAERFAEGRMARVTEVVTALCDARRHRLRELVLHERFEVLDDAEGWSFGRAARDGYVGYIQTCALGPDAAMTHAVAARQSYLATEPRLKTGAGVVPVSHGSEVVVTGHQEGGRWAEVTWAGAARYIPAAHIRPLDAPESDPATVAERFIGTPYLWGGNSGFGLDCSGLVQAAFRACGIACPGDSDLQLATLGTRLSDGAALRRNDLVFWTGHVAMMLDERTIIHANATHMAVTIEPLDTAIARILERGDGPVLARKRAAV